MRGLQTAGGAPLTGDTENGAAPAAPLAARRIAVLAVIVPIIYALDLATKTLVLKTLEGREPIVVIPGVLQFRVIFNSGAAFGLGTGMTIVFTCVAAAVVVAILRTARNLRSLPWAITLSLLLGGALGNLTDRIFRWPSGFGSGRPAPLQGHVVDFVETFPGHFPVWNIADSAIVCGGILAVFLAWRGYQIDGTRDTGAEKEAKENGNG
ncbi:signal peptidase II [Streptosporangium sp. NPDC002544]|uniref:signal peptidase II n=1 Tax=Streptosporangium sp. NPDC002544 TaxID=3154538 RepID=UPI00331FD514